jgi:hypothetical protein
MIVFLTVLCSSSARAADFTWAGNGTTPNWSDPGNWTGHVAPTNGEAITTLTFPDPVCGFNPAISCDSMTNDVSGVTIDRLVVDNNTAASYSIGGAGITLGPGGILGPTSAASGDGVGGLAMPVTLSASQTWTLDGGAFSLSGGTSGASSAVTIDDGGAFFLSGANEIGPVQVNGGFFELDGSLDSTDGHAVTLDNTVFSGGATAGPLTSVGSTLEGAVTVPSATLDAQSVVSYEVSDPANAAQPTLASTGTISLGSSTLHLDEVECYARSPGEQYTIASTTGTLRGVFSNAPDGGVVVVSDCGSSVPYRITYQESGSPQTVTATVLGGPPSVTTGSAVTATSSSATLTGSVNPNGSDVNDCHIEYGLDTTYGSSVPCAQSVGTGTSSVSVSADVSGLTPATTYHFRLVATNGSGTGSGSDATFATMGTSAPTFGTGGAYGVFGFPVSQPNSSASLSATINPHGQQVTWWFTYGEFSEPPGDPGLYPLQSTAQTIPAGTSPVTVSTTIDKLYGDLKYYYRLWVQPAGGAALSDKEYSFTITPPDPVASQAPYLQQNGVDADVGYQAKCVPGTWSEYDGYEIQWVYDNNGVISNAPGSVTETSPGYPGDTYNVGRQDIGKPLACRVIPYALDGKPVTSVALLSDVLFPQKGTGLLILPEWFKTAWDVYDAYGAAKTGWLVGTSALCFTTFEIPVLGEAMCIGSIGLLIDDLQENTIEGLLRSALDPPDPHPAAIPLAQAANQLLKQLCAVRALRHRCPAASSAGRRFALASAQVASLLNAFLVSRNRTLVAREKHNTTAELIQQAVRKTYAGDLATALANQHRASLALAQALRRNHKNLVLPASVGKKLTRMPLTGIISRSLLHELSAEGVTPTLLKHAIANLARHSRRFNLRRSLAAPAPPNPFGRLYNTIDINDLMALITGLAHQHAFRASAVPQLLADLGHARAACSHALRATAIQQFLKDAKPKLKPPYYSFLTAAAQPLTNGASKVDPYPTCLT